MSNKRNTCDFKAKPGLRNTRGRFFCVQYFLVFSPCVHNNKNGSTVLMTQVYTYHNNSVDNSFTSDRVHKITTKVGTTTTTVDYNYDDNGNITQIKKNNQVIQEYEYDSLNQLVNERDFERMIRYQYIYDNNGNIESRKIYGFSVDTNGTYIDNQVFSDNYSYNNSNWKDQLTAFRGNAITYDASGNPLTYKGNNLSWGNGRQLLERQEVVSGTTEYTTYNYDANGYRTTKNTSDRASWSRTHEYKTVDGRITHENVSWGGATSTRSQYLHYYYDSSNQLTGFFLKDYYGGTEGYYTYIKNLQGDITGIVDSTGTQVVSYTYDAYGKLLSITGSLASTVGEYNPMRYRGYYYDSDTGWYYLQSRYYDPDTGRFINADDTGVLQLANKSDHVLATNVFIYCGNNPVNYSDPIGNWGLPSPATIIAGAIIGGVVAAGIDVFAQWLLGGRSFKKFRLSQTILEFTRGAVTGALIACNLRAEYTALGKAIISMVSSLGNSIIRGKFKTLTGAMKSFGVALATGVSSYIFANIWGLYRVKDASITHKGLRDMITKIMYSIIPRNGIKIGWGWFSVWIK